MVGALVAVEGLDGAGKNTLTTAVESELTRRGASVARRAFPRYGTLHADLAADALHGRLAGVVDSPHAMALLFALDRAEAAGDLAAARASHDVVIVDRYCASNAAYTAARLGEETWEQSVRWVEELEFDRLGLDRPDLQLLLATPVGLAARRVEGREGTDSTRTRDRYERDADLQQATARCYARLAERDWAGPWRVLAPDINVVDLCDGLAAP